MPSTSFDSQRSRKYALTKIAVGDYLLPSNSGKTIWRIRRYEDGPSHGLEDWPRDRKVWGIWRWDKPTGVGSLDTGDWSRWEFYEGLLDTRADAIEAALKAGKS
jgi:hypothetical protein